MNLLFTIAKHYHHQKNTTYEIMQPRVLNDGPCLSINWDGSSFTELERDYGC